MTAGESRFHQRRVTDRRYRPASLNRTRVDHAAIAGKEDRTKTTKSKPNEN